jgi:hypothetical protein
VSSGFGTEVREQNQEKGQFKTRTLCKKTQRVRHPQRQQQVRDQLAVEGLSPKHWPPAKSNVNSQKPNTINCNVNTRQWYHPLS